MFTASIVPVSSPVSGSNSRSVSISSPNSATRQARSSRWLGHTSTVSPRIRNVPRANATSLRRYCNSTKARAKVSRSIRPPTSSFTTIFPYVSTDPIP